MVMRRSRHNRADELGIPAFWDGAEVFVSPEVVTRLTSIDGWPKP